MFCPGRILVQQDKWKDSNVISVIDNISNTTYKKQTSGNQEDVKKIDFAKLFEDKNIKWFLLRIFKNKFYIFQGKQIPRHWIKVLQVNQRIKIRAIIA